MPVTCLVAVLRKLGLGYVTQQRIPEPVTVTESRLLSETRGFLAMHGKQRGLCLGLSRPLLRIE